MNNLIVANLKVRQDNEGRFCLNDFHKAAINMGENRRTKEPDKFLNTTRTKELLKLLIAESATQNLGSTLEAQNRASNFSFEPVIKKDTGSYKNRGTFVVKELVYAYGQFVSAEFDLHIIRAYDALVTNTLIKPNRQHEKYWFTKYPHWQLILPLALNGLKNTEIATQLGISADRVSRAIKRMIQIGIIDPVLRIRARWQETTANKIMQLPIFAEWGN